MALLDSGADFTLIHKDMAELIGLDLSKPKEISSGIGGDIYTIETTAVIQIGKKNERYKFKIPILVSRNGASHEILLGRKGFFDKFKITFDEKNEKVTLKRNNLR